QLELLAVRHAVVEPEPVLGPQVRPRLLERALVDRERHPVAARQREVVAAGAAHAVLLLVLLPEQHGAAGLAFDPESTGHVLLLAEAGPGHGSRSEVGGRGRRTRAG